MGAFLDLLVRRGGKYSGGVPLTSSKDAQGRGGLHRMSYYCHFHSLIALSVSPSFYWSVPIPSSPLPFETRRGVAGCACQDE